MMVVAQIVVEEGDVVALDEFLGPVITVMVILPEPDCDLTGSKEADSACVTSLTIEREISDE